ncbi:MAG: carbohydrate-binding family 9-like protein [Pyrinomonadaceae bacterium]
MIKTEVRYLANDFLIDDLANDNWNLAEEIHIDNYWSGEKAPTERHLKARLLWSDTTLYVCFAAKQAEPLVMSDLPNLTSKTDGLWDRDVCEIFIAPDQSEPHKYFEFEVAPNGEWLDLAINLTDSERKTDRNYKSGMQSCAKIDESKVQIAAKIEWEAFGSTPRAGDIWLGNLFRCIGKDPDRGYLAWSPTYTELPNFHVPDSFGQFKFIK